MMYQSPLITRNVILATVLLLTPTCSFLSPFLLHTKPIQPTTLTRVRMATSSTELNKSASSTKNDPFNLKTLFPEPTWDDESIHRDLYEVLERDGTALNKDNITFSNIYRFDNNTFSSVEENDPTSVINKRNNSMEGNVALLPSLPMNTTSSSKNKNGTSTSTSSTVVDRELTKMVEERLFGYQTNNYADTIRYGSPLKVNADKLTYHAKKLMRSKKFKEAIELYNQALDIDPRDGRPYLGLSRIAERKKELKLARDWLRQGIAHSSTNLRSERMNPFLLQALGCLEERAGNLAEAETLYIESVKIRSWHAASWVSLAQLRVWKLRRGAASGRVCFQTAVYELNLADAKPNAYIYTAWARMEYEIAGDARTAKILFQKAIAIDPKSSAAWFQLGLMESSSLNFEKAIKCFETVLKFDPNNSRVLQAYAIMESKRAVTDSRHVIDLFERALKVRNGRYDAGVYQAYALFVATLGDLDGARDLLRRGTEVDKRHAPVWQAWGVLETKHGSPQTARKIFQQGIWNCAQSSGTQAGGRNCARLWQAWGILEKRTRNFSAARKCFSRALDADAWNVPSVTAWAKMEEELGNVMDARGVFERSLSKFSSKAQEKKGLWRAYELMESRLGNTHESQLVFGRYTSECMNSPKNTEDRYDLSTKTIPASPEVSPNTDAEEIEVYRISSSRDFVDGEVWMNNGSIEGKIPMAAMKRSTKKNLPIQNKSQQE